MIRDRGDIGAWLLLAAVAVSILLTIVHIFYGWPIVAVVVVAIIGCLMMADS